jgi:Dolichyl-phosphate-mannose-protein mannosyltransferase
MLTALLPLLTVILLLVTARARLPCWRIAFLVAAVLWGLAVVISTEVLSLWHALNFWGVLLSWMALSGLLAWWGWRNREQLARLSLVTAVPLSAVDRLLLLGVAAIVMMVGILGLLAPPNSWDAMTYHMSRVVHWIQHQSIAHYPTPIARQLHAPPWAEFAILLLQVLTKGDRLANLVQWFSMVVSLVGVSLLAKQLGGDRRSQILATVVAATLPMGIMQGSSTQNDYAATCWLTCMAVFVLFINGQPRGAPVRAWALLVGAALGLALLTKAVAYIFALPMLVWMAFVQLRRGAYCAWRTIALVAVVVALINAGYYIRNIETYGAPLGPGREGALQYANAVLGGRALISVIVRNVGLHLGTPWPDVNALTNAAVGRVHRSLGVDINNPAITWGETKFAVSLPVYHEDYAGNVWHAMLAVLALGAVAGCPDLRRRHRLVIYTGVPLIGFVLFSAVLRWQPWHSRLLLPLFVLGAPVLGIVLSRRRVLGSIVALGLVLATVPWLVFNEAKRLVGPANVLYQPREQQYFALRPDHRGPYTEAVEQLKKRRCATLGLLTAADDWEYPLWVLVEGALGREQLRLKTVGIPDQRTHPFEPCAIVATYPVVFGELTVGRQTYRRTVFAPPVVLFLPEGQPDGAGWPERGGDAPPGAYEGAGDRRGTRAHPTERHHGA